MSKSLRLASSLVIGCLTAAGGAAGCGGGSPGGMSGSGGLGGNGMPGTGGRVADTCWLTGTMKSVQAFAGPSGRVPDVAAAPPPKHVTHVMAVDPSSQNPRPVTAPVSGGGTFSLPLEPGRPWVLVFVDSSRAGADMIAGIF